MPRIRGVGVWGRGLRRAEISQVARRRVRCRVTLLGADR